MRARKTRSDALRYTSSRSTDMCSPLQNLFYSDTRTLTSKPTREDSVAPRVQPRPCAGRARADRIRSAHGRKRGELVFVASKGGHTEVVRELLRSGARGRAIIWNSHRYTCLPQKEIRSLARRWCAPLHSAAERGHSDTIWELIMVYKHHLSSFF